MFKKLIPLKELQKIIGLNAIQNVDMATVENDELQQNNNTKEKLKQLNEMKEEGLITNDEFLDKLDYLFKNSK